MAKVALLVGVSDYEPGLEPLPSAVKDVAALQQVLANPEMGEFADAAVTVLQNPSRQAMEDAIYSLFANRQRDDLVLFYFSGHGVVDEGGEFYFASRFTRKEQGKLVPTTAVAARPVRDWVEQSRSQRKIIILDSCFSGAFARGVQAKDSGSVNPEQFLGGKGTAILTASTSTQYALTQDSLDLSVYTHYLVEGIRTVGADQDDDGWIAAEELHAYAKSKVKEAAPAMTPEFYPVKEGYKILLAKSPKDDPQLKYRKQVKLLAEEDEGEFTPVNRAYLDELRQILGLRPEDTNAIETEELEPYRQLRAKVDRYREVFSRAIAHRYPLTERDRAGLQRLQQLLSLRDEDVEAIKAPILAAKQAEYERQQEAVRQEEQQRQRLKQQAEIRFWALRQSRYWKRLQRQRRKQQIETARKKREEQEQQRQAGQDWWQQERSLHEDSPQTTSSLSEGSRPQQSAPVTAPPTITRQQFLKWAGFGGGGLVVTLLVNQIIQNGQSPQISSPQISTIDFETVKVDSQGQVTERVPSQASVLEQDLGDGVMLEMVKIPAGDFLMGTAEADREAIIQEATRHEVSQENAEEWTDSGMPEHRVQVPEFWIGKFAVTQAQWRQVAGWDEVNPNVDINADPANFKGAKRPVENVSLDQAVEFCERLSERTGRSYRLPTEAEWEYACRAGTTTPFHFGETITADLANCNGQYPYGDAPETQYRAETTDVGIFPANAFGLHDMHGNVWEWCADQWYGSYANKPEQLKQNGAIAWAEETTGMAPKSDESNYRLLRGGSWRNFPWYCRSAPRNWFALDDRDYSIGFRVVCSVSRIS
jgi:formylglycine-generating enzyme required for sulfatase activity/uncharacterized caspase-like protein